MLEIRHSGYEKQLANFRAQVATVYGLKAEINELKEHLGQNSGNSSKPPDLPTHKTKPPSEAQGRGMMEYLVSGY